ncbi:MAG: tRNA (5-methylaminomethyl-2-thiouridine)(34)-methyltransferase MnmD [Bacteroidia bacterium]|nr:tRNA (5-methylaminomethyl-2-thiouridine)(34)-methyltransferase MnmD [Bacteroidia bacterium]
MITPESALQPVITGDGSQTLFSTQFQAHYHSIHGAVQESLHVFIRMGWEALPAMEDPVYILEMGLGTGLNAWLTSQHAQRAVYYHAVETHPVPAEVYTGLSYTTDATGQAQFEHIHLAPWEEPTEIRPGFVLLKHQQPLQTFRPEAPFHLVYYDAFAPDTQPELWTAETLAHVRSLMCTGGVWVSYCAKGVVRRTLQAVGFRVERCPGPPGKHEMLRAIAI